jgi:hypothetical protein
MMRLFEEVLLEDEYRTILGIHSYEQGLDEPSSGSKTGWGWSGDAAPCWGGDSPC